MPDKIPTFVGMTGIKKRNPGFRRGDDRARGVTAVITLTIDDKNFDFEGAHHTNLNNLVDLCYKKYTEQTSLREQSAIEYLKKFDDAVQKNEKKSFIQRIRGN